MTTRARADEPGRYSSVSERKHAMSPNQRTRWLLAGMLAISLPAAGWTADQAPAGKPAKPAPAHPPGPKPTQANVAYGTHPKQVLDFWKAESDRPTPLLFFIHGG